jgi:integrase
MWWAHAYAKMINRARKLLLIEHAEFLAVGKAPPKRDVFDTGVHWLCHFYASHSLAPENAGGRDWSISFVQKQLGHASSRTTELIYQHIIQPERELARKTRHTWPGL